MMTSKCKEIFPAMTGSTALTAGGRINQAIAVAVVSALLVTAPGLPFYQVFAQSVPTAITTTVPGAGVVPGGVLGNPAMQGGNVQQQGPGYNGLGRGFGSSRFGRKAFGVSPSRGSQPADAGADEIGVLRTPSAPQGEVTAAEDSIKEEAGTPVTEQLIGVQQDVKDAVSNIGAVKNMSAAEAYGAGNKAILAITKEKWRSAEGLPSATYGTKAKILSPSPALRATSPLLRRGEGKSTALRNGMAAPSPASDGKSNIPTAVRTAVAAEGGGSGKVSGADVPVTLMRDAVVALLQKVGEVPNHFWTSKESLAKSITDILQERGTWRANFQKPDGTWYKVQVLAPVAFKLAAAVWHLAAVSPDKKIFTTELEELQAQVARSLDQDSPEKIVATIRASAAEALTVGYQPSYSGIFWTQYKRTSGGTRVEHTGARNGFAAAPAPAGDGKSKFLAAVRVAASIGGGAALVMGAQIAGVMLMPGAFGLVPFTAAFMVSNAVLVGLIWNPVKLRMQLAKSDAQGITLARVAVDVALGAVTGAIIASGSVLGVAGFMHLPSLLANGIADIFAGAGGMGTISPAPLLGMAGLAVLARSADLLQNITGKTQPSSQLKAFLERFLFISMGVPYALASGFVAPGKFVTGAFIAWNISQSKPALSKILNIVFVGGWLYAGFMSFATPATFLLVAFTPDRAVALMDWIVNRNATTPGQGKVAPEDNYSFRRWITHPPTGERIKRLESDKIVPGARDPFHYKLKTVLLMGSMGALAIGTGAFLSGWAALVTPLAIMGVLMGVIAWYSHIIAVKAQGGLPYQEAMTKYPSLAAKIQASYNSVDKLSKKLGFKTPDFFFIPHERFPGPNAFATGFSPNRAAVAVTEDILGLMNETELEGVLAHEMNHVKHRDIVMGSIMGAMGSAVSWAVYNIMWKVVSAAQVKLPAAPTDRGVDVTGPGNSQQPQAVGEYQTQVFPVLTGAGPWTAAFFKLLASIYITVIGKLLQMGHTRNREFYADEDGALLMGGNGKPLADALRRLSEWRPGKLTLEQSIKLRIAFAMDSLMFVSPIEQFLGRDPDDGNGANGGNVKPAAAPPVQPMGPDAFKQSGPSEGTSAKATAPVDYDRAPGLDQGLLPTVRALETLASATPERKKDLGHLMETLSQMLAQGGSLKYGTATVETAQGPASLPAAYDSGSNTLVISPTLRRVDARLLAIVLGQQLQAAYDSKHQRLTPILETEARQLKVIGSLLAGLDLKSMAAGLDINNPSELQLFKGLTQQHLASLQSQYNPQPLDSAQGEPAPNAAAYLSQLQGSVAALSERLRDLQDQVTMINDGLTRTPGDAGLERDKKVLEIRVQHVQGTLYMAQQQLIAFMKEEPQKLALKVGAAVSLADLPMLKVEATKVDPRLSPVIANLRSRIENNPAIKERMGVLLSTLDRIVAEGGRVSFGPTPDGTIAYFSPVTLDMIVSDRYEKAHPVLLASALAHELTHADDYFSGRAMTRETEYNAFTNEGLFLQGVDANILAHEVVPADRSKEINLAEINLYHASMHVQQMATEGKISVHAMVSNSYTQQVWTNLSGLLTASQLLEELKTRQLGPVQQALGELQRRIQLIEGASAANRSGREDQLEFLKRVAGAYGAMLSLYERQKSQYEATIREFGAEPFDSAQGMAPAAIPDVTKPLILSRIDNLSPPGQEFGGLGSVIAPAPEPAVDAPAIQASRGGMLSRAWDAVSSVLSDRSRNRSFWFFTLGQAMIILGFVLHAGAMPALLGFNSKSQGTVQAIGDAATAASGFSTGPEVDKRPTQGLLVWTGFARALFLMMIPGLYFIDGHVGAAAYAVVGALSVAVFVGGRKMGWMPWAALLMPSVILFVSGGHLGLLAISMIVASAAFFQTTSITVSQVALMKILANETTAYRKANTVLRLAANVVSVAGFYAAAKLIGFLSDAFGGGAGPVIVAGLYGAFTIFSSAITGLFLHVPNDRTPLLEARAQAEATDGSVRAGFSERVREFFEGIRLIFKNRFLRLSVAIVTFETMFAKPLIVLVIIQYASAMLVNGATNPGTYSLLMSYASLGATIALVMLLVVPALMAHAQKAQGRGLVGLLLAPLRAINRLVENIPGDDIERQATVAYWLAAAGHLMFWGFVVTGNLAVAAGLMIAMSLLSESATVSWDSLLNKVLGADGGELGQHKGKIVSTLNFIDTVCRIVGYLTIGAFLTGLVVPAFSIGSLSMGPITIFTEKTLHQALWWGAVAASLSAMLLIIEPFLVFPLDRKSKKPLSQTGGTNP